MDKTVKFKIELETNGQKVLHDVTVSTGELRDALVEVGKEAKLSAEKMTSLASTSMMVDALNNVVDRLCSSVNDLADDWNSFDKGMRAVNTMAGKNAEDLGKLKDQVAALGNEIPKTKEELSAGLYQVISNGVPENNWIAFLEQSAKASVGGIADLGQTVTVTSTIIKNYGLEWDKVGEIQDKIQMTAKNGVTSFEQLAAALPRVSGNAATLGVSIDELMATFATLTGVSGNTAEVSTQLAAVFTALVKPSTEATTMAQQMGIQFDAAAIKAAGGMRNFLTQLNTDIEEYAAAHGMLEQEIYGKLFGSAESLRALIPLTGELSDKFGENVDAMAGSTGTIDQAFENMAGSGEAVTQILKNQLSTMLDWAGSLASSIQPYLTFVAVGGQAISGLALLYKGVVAAVGAVKAFAVAQRGSAAATAMATIHERIQTTARNMLTVATGTATVGTTALTVATIALYAALTMGLSAIITGLVALFSSMGDEAEEASEDVDLLKESTDAFFNASSNAAAELEMEKRKLKELITSNEDASKTVDELNRKYGEAFGTHKTAAEWYDILITKSKAYCTQLGYEAQAKVLASQKAAKELERDNLMRNYQWMGQQYWDKNGNIHYNWEQNGGEQAYKQMGEQLAKLDNEIATLQQNFDVCVDKMAAAQKEFQAAGNASNSAAAALNWQTMSYAALGKAIEQQKTKLSGYADASTAEAKKETAQLKQMEARYKKLGVALGLASESKTGKTGKGSHTDPYSGKTLIANAQTYKELGNNIKYYETQLEKLKPTETAEINRIGRIIADLKEAQATLKVILESAGRPTEIKSLEDIETELAYLKTIRNRATQEELAGIDKQIDALDELRESFELAGHVEVPIEEISTYGQLAKELEYYQKKLRTAAADERQMVAGRIAQLQRLQQIMEEADHVPLGVAQITTMHQLDEGISYHEGRLKRAAADERSEIAATLRELKKLKAEWEEQADLLEKPQDISTLTSIEKLEEAITWYQTQLRRANSEEIEGLQNTINALEAKRDALTRLGELTKQQEEIDDLQGLNKKQLKIELDLIGLEGVKGKIRDLQKMLADTKNPLNAEARKEVESMVDQWKAWEGQLKRSSVKLDDTWGAIKGVSSGITGITDALKDDGNAWEKISGVIDGVLQLYESFSSIIEIVKMLTAATQGHTAAKAVEAATVTEGAAMEVGATTSVAEANVVEANTAVAAAAAETMKAHASIPFVGIAIGAGMVSTMLGLLFALPKFADGGLAYGPTLGLFGEYAGASNNPEVVAPLSKLKGMLADVGGLGGGRVVFKIEGRTLVGILKKETTHRSRTK